MAHPPSLRHLALADARPEDIETMLREGETFIEFKERIPAEGIGPTVASFANTLGGWMILGVTNERKVVGYRPPGRADVLDYVRDLLSNEVDPLPPFAAKALTLSGAEIAVVRVYESADTPHIVRGTGAVYVREPGRKAPIGDHGRLIELARRGEDAQARAERNLDLPLIESVVPSPTRDSAVLHPPHLLVRAAPLTLTPRFADAALSQKTAQWCESQSAGLLARVAGGAGRAVWQPHGRGVIVTRRVEGVGPRGSCVLVVDAGGAVAIRLTWNSPNEPVPLTDLRDSRFLPAIQAIAETLEGLEVYGRAAIDAWIWGLNGKTIDGGEFGSGTAPFLQHLGGGLVLPAENDQLDALAGSWMREYGRGSRLPTWEPG